MSPYLLRGGTKGDGMSCNHCTKVEFNRRAERGGDYVTGSGEWGVGGVFAKGKRRGGSLPVGQSLMSISKKVNPDRRRGPRG